MSYNASFVSALKEALNGLKTIHQVGEEWASYVGDIPTGGVPYCGQEVNRSTYSALWEYANAKGLVKSESEWQSLYNTQGGNVAFYSSGNGSSTFRMPRLVGYVRGASGQSEAGGYIKEGLPNIVGGITTVKSVKNAEGTGAFATSAKDGNGYTGTQTDGNMVISFDASLCSPIYGNSSHVTPETSVVLYGVYAFGEIGNTSALDASTLASAVARVESNLESAKNDFLASSTAHIVETWAKDDGSAWYRKYSDGWVEQGGNLKVQSWNWGSTWTVTLPVPLSSIEFASAIPRNGGINGSGYYKDFTGSTVVFGLTEEHTQSFSLGGKWRVDGYI